MTRRDNKIDFYEIWEKKMSDIFAFLGNSEWSKINILIRKELAKKITKNKIYTLSKYKTSLIIFMDSILELGQLELASIFNRTGWSPEEA